MKIKPITLVLVVAVFGAGGFGIYSVGMKRGMTMGGSAPAAATAEKADDGEEATRRHMQQGIKAGDVDPLTGKTILFYQDPMVPGKRFDAPGKSPFMDMLLVPVYAGADADQGTVSVSPRIQQNLGIRTAEVVSGPLVPRVAAVGAIAYNERVQVLVQARATGYIERLHVRATLDRVHKGQALADLYVPDWVAAQEEYLSVRRMQGGELEGLIDGARSRMRQAGMSEEQMRLIESSGRIHPRITLTAPVGGVIAELSAREGMTVLQGATLFRLNGLDSVWANAEVPESQVGSVHTGSMVEARLPAVPETVFKGRVQAILPEVNPGTRTIKARVELVNQNGALSPGMFVNMTFVATGGREALLIPSEAVIRTGKRSVVMVAEADGKFHQVDVETGLDSNGQTEIRRGLEAGQKVVVSGQFLIDSEASLTATATRLGDAPPPTAGATQQHVGNARIEAIHQDTVTLSHGPIASMDWGPMTMDFRLPAAGLPRGIKAGDQVRFEFAMGSAGPQLLAVTLLAAGGERK
jgi:Cu(I)/Ag(I) efflux system membrane fusion protein